MEKRDCKDKTKHKGIRKVVKFHDTTEFFAKRIRCNICLDPDSELFGCGDRNYWHYKIRDFPSVILQQGVESAVRSYSQFCSPEALSLANAAAKFWTTRALGRNAFEEYYPFENGYPPLAFSTLSICRLIEFAEINIDEVPNLRKALEIAGKQLSSRIEREAVNQYTAGIAALAALVEFGIISETKSDLSSHVEILLNFQNTEGWFPEYGSFDLGYLSVTIDCLWDLYDKYPDPRILTSIDKAVRFIVDVTSIGRISFGKLNSRNTDYIVPYGLMRSYERSKSKSLLLLLHQIYDNLWLYESLDDRYLMHYIGVSFVRANEILNNGLYLPKQNKEIQFNPDDFPNAGLKICEFKKEIAWLNYQKGVVCSKSHSDWGVRVYRENKYYESGVVPYLSLNPPLNDVFIVNLTQQREFSPSFFKMTIIKILAFMFGRRIITYLKRRVIHKHDAEITLRFDTQTGLNVVSQKITNEVTTSIRKAPRQSIRHVASAEWNL